MSTTTAHQAPELCPVIREFAHDSYCLELIQFFGWHPNARFSAKAVLHSIGGAMGRRYIELALQRLVDKGLVSTYSEDSLPLYCLTEEETHRRQAIEIARLDWGQWQSMLRDSQAYIWEQPAAMAA